MQTKQKLKYKQKLPKANFGLDPRSLDNMNKTGANPEEESGSTMDAAGKGIGIASSVLQGVSSFMPQDNMDGIGVSHKGSSIAKGVSGGLKTGASVAKAIPGVGTIVGGVMDAGAAIADMVTGWVDKARENDPTKVSKLARKEYQDSYSNVGYSFGTPAAKNGMVLNSQQQPKVKLDFDMERQLPSDLAYERDVNKFDYNFIKNNVPKELQEYQQGLPLPNNYRIYKTPKGYYNVYDEKNINIGYSQDGKNYIKGEPQFELGGDPRHLSDVEAEKGEAIQRGNKVIAIGGNTHENGGTPLKVQPNDKYIYSDTLGLDSDGKISVNPKTVTQTFATLAKRTETKYKGKSDDLSLKTKDLELKMLTSKAEEARVLKEQTDEMKIMKKYKAKYGMNLATFSGGGIPIPKELEGDPYSQWSNIFYSNSGKYPTVDDYNALSVNPTTKAINPTMQSSVGLFQNWVKEKDNTMLSKYGVDGKWGKESNAAWTKYGQEYTNLLSDKPSVGIGVNNGLTPLFNGNLPSGPTSGMYDYDKVHEEDSQFYSNLSAAQKAKVPSVSGPAEGDLNRKTQNGLFQNLSQGDKIQLAGMLPAVAYNLGMGLRKSEVEQAKKNPYESNILNMMANRKFDMQPYLNEANLANNVAREDIGNNSTSVGGKVANLQKLYANNLNALQSLTAKEQEVNNNYRAEEANVKNTLGENARREEIRISDINAQNRATKQNFLGKATQQIGQGINTLGRGANQSLTNQMQIKAMSELSPDYDIRPLRELYKSGQVDENGLLEFNGNKYIYDPKRNVATYVGPSTTAAAPTDQSKSPYSPIPFSLKNSTNSTKPKKSK